MTPEEVAKYAFEDSRSLSLVDTEYLLDELSIRATESCTITKLDIIKSLRQLADKSESQYKRSI